MSESREWIDEDTGYRIVRLTNEPGSSSLYFNFNGYTPEGDCLVVSTPTGLDKVHLSSLRPEPLLRLDRPFKFLFVGQRYRRAYYQTLDDDAVWYVDVDSGIAHHIAGAGHGDIQTINSDETLLGGVERDQDDTSEILKLFEKRDKVTDQFDYRAEWPDGTAMSYADAKEVRLNERMKAGVRMTMFVIDTKTGVRRNVHESRNWLNHLLFSPVDPELLMYCHEGNWHCVDRMWLLNIGQTLPTPLKVHQRTMNMEIAGHEWWSSDGSTIWYDLQTPRGETFYVAGYDIKTKRRRWYHVEDRNHWSVHYHSSADNSNFCGDGGDETMVAHAKNGKWLYLFHPRQIPDVAGLRAEGADNLIRPGYLDAVRLVNLKDQDYRLEPNAHFSPDGRFVVFRGNMEGAVHTYAVDLSTKL